VIQQQTSLNLLILLMISSQPLTVYQRRQHHCNRGEESLTYKACTEKLNDVLLNALSSVHATVMYIPLATVFCVDRWEHVIDVMLEKISGVERSNKLRIIKLPEADLNQVLMHCLHHEYTPPPP
jgi:hypothetical protein